MIWYIFGGLGVFGLLGIRNALQINAAANLYSAIKDQLPPAAPIAPPPPPKPWWQDFIDGSRG
jgi:hypothetical protein